MAHIKVGIIGDFDPERDVHAATEAAIRATAGALALEVELQWLPTDTLGEPGADERLRQFDGLWCSPGSPYRSMSGALAAICFAREQGWPFFAT
jgi:CTP synthase (UTP-ammonia lyase)